MITINPLCSSWFHVNSNLLQPVSYGPRLRSVAHMLVVEDARPEDGGQYRCTARNEMGEISVTLHLQVEPPLVVGEWDRHSVSCGVLDCILR